MNYPQPPSVLFTPPPKFKALLEQQTKHAPLPLVADFIHQCSPDPSVRANLVTQYVLSIWQLAGGRMSPRFPSLITISPPAKSPNLDGDFATLIMPETIKSLPVRALSQEELSQVEKQGQDPAETLLRKNAATEAWLHERLRTESVLLKNHKSRAPRTIFEKAPCRSCGAALHKHLGFITDESNEVILRVENKDDRDFLRRAAITSPKTLTHPVGYGRNMETVFKKLCLSGRLPLSDWDSTFATSLIDLGLPLLTLPGITEPLPEIPHLDELRKFAQLASRQQTPLHDEPSNLVEGACIDIFTEEIRERLYHLPPAYEYAIQKMSRQLILVCFNLADFWGTLSNSSQDEVQALAHDLNEYTLRGVALGLAILSWHGLGFDPGCSQDSINRVLKYLRSRKPMSKSELLRGAHLKKEERDKILGVLEKENLVRIEDKTVSKNSFKNFTAALYARHNLTQPENHWGTVQ
ncbi:hypothetical protein OAE47_00505 [Akkermansiaceae bacterium]|nr:hypothetical protein [Akkermansiaceae bacterium]